MAGMGGIDPNLLQQMLTRQGGGGITNPWMPQASAAMAQGPAQAPPPGQPAGSPDYASWYDPNDPQGSFMRLVQGKPANSETLNSLAPYLQGVGGQLENANAAGVRSKIVLPNGQIVRVGNMFDAPGAQTSWGWTVQPTSRFQPGGGMGESSARGGAASPSGQPGSFIDDPSYKFMLNEGINALQRSAAAKGTLLTGGTMKALNRFAQDYANTGYQNAFNRNLSVSQLGLQGAEAAARNASSYGNLAAGLYGGLGNAQAAGTVGRTNPWMGALEGVGNLAGEWAAGRNLGNPTRNTGTFGGMNPWVTT